MGGDYHGTKAEFIIGFYGLLSIRPLSGKFSEPDLAVADLGQGLQPITV